LFSLVGRQVSPQSPRYLVIPQPSMSVLRIDSAKAGKDDAKYECVAENGVGDAVVASATLSIYPGKKNEEKQKRKRKLTFLIPFTFATFSDPFSVARSIYSCKWRWRGRGRRLKTTPTGLSKVKTIHAAC
jgi:hypothetical protein